MTIKPIVPRAAALLFALVLVPAFPGQVIQHETRTVNVEIPVRVFRGDAFVDELTIDDFEIYEDGRLQAIEAVYLIRDTAVARRQEVRAFAPETLRNFTLIFQMSEFDPKLAEALGGFVDNVLAPGDLLTVVTPVKAYRLKGDLLAAVGPLKVRDDLLGIVRRDILAGNGEYRGAIEDLSGMARTLAAKVTESVEATLAGDAFTAAPALNRDLSIEEMLNRYAEILQRLRSLRRVDRQAFLDFATALKTQPGQKSVFLFYQREFVPMLDAGIVQQLQSAYQDVPTVATATADLFDLFRWDDVLDVEPIQQAFADASAAVHFLFLTTPARRVPGLRMEEHSEDLYAPFLEMARATGGFSASSANMAALMRGAAGALANYYLLYYTPRDYRPDGSFRKLDVRVKGGGVRVSHRAGYIAD